VCLYKQNLACQLFDFGKCLKSFAKVEINQTFLCQISYSEKDVGSGIPNEKYQSCANE
jgi:hypothetical protein